MLYYLKPHFYYQVYSQFYATLINPMIDLKPLLGEIAHQYRLDPSHTHGLSHWARVLENGLKLAETEGGDTTVISLFAIFHDSCRHNQSRDFGHGARGAKLAERLLIDNPAINSTQLQLLIKACRGHTNGRTRADITIQVCWDSDRLDLARVGILPHPRRLCTRTAKDPEILDWANDRALSEFSPLYVEKDWFTLFN
jgi:uncharacterized protein